MERAELEKKIAQNLAYHVGQEHAVDRWGLVVWIFGRGADVPRTDQNRADRAVRRAIEHMRHQGAIICNQGDGEGWFLPATDEEYRAFRSMYGSHAFPILENIRAMDRTAQERWPNLMQPRLL